VLRAPSEQSRYSLQRGPEFVDSKGGGGRQEARRGREGPVTAISLGSMGTLSARAAYKKQAGTLALTATHLVWTADGAPQPLVRVAAADVNSAHTPAHAYTR
jgi:hypothetical protein